jgi:hypothetical protein
VAAALVRPIQDCSPELRDRMIVPSGISLHLFSVIFQYVKDLRNGGMQVEIIDGDATEAQCERGFALKLNVTTLCVEDVVFGEIPASTVPNLISSSLLLKTRRVWSLHFRRIVPIEEAVQMLERVRRLTRLAISTLEGSNQ